ncbi:type I restriction enzyme HsdR N-terminal domain-containing protein [Aquitalea denitrificans]|uniref:type I restriction enzyme HsdR N-terminal domain-containing protein n=1 Tax=Aquitalea denitrificans TaxID=519081 RepID=UPI00135AB7DC|nr:type I restriction enzyme HsdR N-terminal domain-containing protein [Aquitalea denitrificans]
MLKLPILDELKTESDVEQKLIFPLLTTDHPYGLGIPSTHVLTKLSIRKLKIGKGQEEKLYFPDYILMSEGYPVAIVEAKIPGESLDIAFREARLYAYEINAKFDEGINPVQFILACNGEAIMFGPADVDVGRVVSLDDLNVSCQGFADLQAFCNFGVLQRHSSALAKKQKPDRFWKPKKFLGGSTVQAEEVGRNTFGLALSAEFGHIFAPETTEDRSVIAKEAYVDSKMSSRAILPIDRIIRAAKPPSETNSQLIKDRANPTELFSKLRAGSSLEQKILLLIGSVGSGKSTFVDYLIYKALPADIITSTLWCRLDMNSAPVSSEDIYKWLRQRISEKCIEKYPDEDFDDLDILKKVYGVEFNRFEKIQGRLLRESGDTIEYNRELVRQINEWEGSDEVRSKAISRYCCGERGKLLIIVLDNCDKRSRDEQLLMFQAAQWIQREYRALIILPLREETYEVYQDQPPLDTALKDLIFRIEAPLFQHVLVKRVQLALSRMNGGKTQSAHYDLPNGFRVECPRTDQAFYLASIIRSLFEHDKFIRRMIAGLSGRNIRKALEIFIDFCNSAHLGEDEIFKIRQHEGKYTLPLYLVTRILLRGNLRFYDGQDSVVKNFFDIFHKDNEPFYFSRLMILNWLNIRFSYKGTNGVRGYFPVSLLKADLIGLGVPDYVLDRELDFLLKAHCITSESLNVGELESSDLIRISSAGVVHLDLLGSIDYLATIAEDTWFDDQNIARKISERIVKIEKHFHIHTQLDNARDVVCYLNEKLFRLEKSIGSFIAIDSSITSLWSLDKAKKAIDSVESAVRVDEWFDLDKRYQSGSIFSGRIVNRTPKHGLFIELEPGIVALLHKSKLLPDYMQNDDFMQNEIIECKIIRIDTINRKISLDLVVNN